MNVYLKEIESILPRILGAINQNQIHPLYGVSDRQFWAWRTIDFGNATNQGSVDGLTTLLKGKLWPYPYDNEIMVTRINSLFSGTEKLMRTNGSLEESFPFEQSWCVSALVSYNLAGALINSKENLTREVYEYQLSLISKMQNFVISNPENHAKISNHIAVAAASLFRGYQLTGVECLFNKAQMYLNVLINCQDNDGGFMEYHGFDPGYQTLTMDYLADIYLAQKLDILKPVITKSLEILSYFLMPDGSFGGNFGARGTQVYYPGGVARLIHEFPLAMRIHNEMKPALQSLSSTTLKGIDEGNLIPLFNSYCHAAIIENKKKSIHSGRSYKLQNRTTVLKDSGYVIDKGNNYYTIVSLFRGGYFEHYRGKKKKITGHLPVIESKGFLYSAFIFNSSNRYDILGNQIIVYSKLGRIQFRVQDTSRFIIGRIAFLVTSRSPRLNSLLKKIIVKHFFGTRISSSKRNIRRITLGYELSYSDEIECPFEIRYTQSNLHFIHEQMASANYWQISRERKEA